MPSGLQVAASFGRRLRFCETHRLSNGAWSGGFGRKLGSERPAVAVAVTLTLTLTGSQAGIPTAPVKAQPRASPSRRIRGRPGDPEPRPRAEVPRSTRPAPSCARPAPPFPSGSGGGDPPAGTHLRLPGRASPPSALPGLRDSPACQTVDSSAGQSRSRGTSFPGPAPRTPPPRAGDAVAGGPRTSNPIHFTPGGGASKASPKVEGRRSICGHHLRRLPNKSQLNALSWGVSIF